jgi:lycopene cyclase domain-containing protein
VSYLVLALLFVLGSAGVAAYATVSRGLGARWWTATGLTVAVLLLLTVVFDSLMIAADLFRFDADSLVGLRLWQAPVEDLAWPVAAGLLLPSLWELGRREEVRR